MAVVAEGENQTCLVILLTKKLFTFSSILDCLCSNSGPAIPPFFLYGRMIDRWQKSGLEAEERLGLNHQPTLVSPLFSRAKKRKKKQKYQLNCLFPPPPFPSNCKNMAKCNGARRLTAKVGWVASCRQNDLTVINEVQGERDVFLARRPKAL